MQICSVTWQYALINVLVLFINYLSQILPSLTLFFLQIYSSALQICFVMEWYLSMILFYKLHIADCAFYIFFSKFTLLLSQICFVMERYILMSILFYKPHISDCAFLYIFFSKFTLLLSQICFVMERYILMSILFYKPHIADCAFYIFFSPNLLCYFCKLLCNGTVYSYMYIVYTNHIQKIVLFYFFSPKFTLASCNNGVLSSFTHSKLCFFIYIQIQYVANFTPLCYVPAFIYFCLNCLFVLFFYYVLVPVLKFKMI